MGTTYVGEANGARIIRNGIGLTQVGDGPYQVDFETWDIVPAGEMGDVSFRSIDVSLKVGNGYSLGITPILDGVALAEQQFSGAGTGQVQAQAFIAERGTRIAARVRTLALAGDVEILDVSAAFWVLRRSP